MVQLLLLSEEQHAFGTPLVSGERLLHKSSTHRSPLVMGSPLLRVQRARKTVNETLFRMK